MANNASQINRLDNVVPLKSLGGDFVKPRPRFPVDWPLVATMVGVVAALVWWLV